MKLSKKQENAIETAINVMSATISSGLDNDEDRAIGDAIEELVKMKDSSLAAKAKTKKNHWRMDEA